MISSRMEWIIFWFLAQNSLEPKISQGPDFMAEHEHRNATNAAVVHNASKQRFEINIDGQVSVLEYTFKINPGSEA
jgi:hypothetical protein